MPPLDPAALDRQPHPEGGHPEGGHPEGGGHRETWRHKSDFTLAGDADTCRAP